MSNDRWATWQAERAGTNTAPAMRHVFALAVAVVVLALILAAGQHQASTPATVRPVDTPVCAELARLERHGFTTGAGYRATRAACQRARAEVSGP